MYEDQAVLLCNKSVNDC